MRISVTSTQLIAIVTDVLRKSSLSPLFIPLWLSFYYFILMTLPLVVEISWYVVIDVVSVSTLFLK